MAYFYPPDLRRDEPVILALTEAAERYPRYGFKKLFQVLHRQDNAGITSACPGFIHIREKDRKNNFILFLNEQADAC